MVRTKILCGLALVSFGCAEAREALGSLLQGEGAGSTEAGGAPASEARSEPEPPSPCAATDIDSDELHARVSADLAALSPAERRFARYVSVANEANAGVCSSIAIAGQALSKLLNGTSSRRALSRPTAIDPSGLIYRFDLRDYGWNRAIALGAETFTDGWEALLAVSPFALEYSGPDADSAKAMAATSVVVIALDAFAGVAAIGDLYYALGAIPEDFAALLESLDVDVEAAVESGAALWAGTSASRVSRLDRAIERYPIPGRDIGLWRARDFATPEAFPLFDDPLSTAADGSVVFYPLRNGMLAFGLFDANGVRVESTDLILDAKQRDFRVRASSSCTNCHSTGPLSFEDEVRPFVEANAGDFEPEVVSAVQAIYPTAAEAQAIVQADSNAYQSALVVADAVGAPGDPIASTLFEFERALSRSDVAGDLLVPVAVLEAQLSVLPPLLSEDAIDRADFAAVFAESACILHAGAANQPVGCP